jgi:hypothetical protein
MKLVAHPTFHVSKLKLVHEHNKKDRRQAYHLKSLNGNVVMKWETWKHRKINPKHQQNINEDINLQRQGVESKT